MFDVGHLPPNFRGDYQEFFGIAGDISAAYTQFHTWRKPRGTHMHLFLGASAGGGGGGGHSAAAGSARGGGGGGQSGCMFSMLLPTFMVPDVLYFAPNRPGLGGAPASAGAATTGLYFITHSVHSAAVATNQFLHLVNSNGTNPGAGTGAAAGGGGGAPTVAANTNWPLGIIGQTVTIAGQAGAAGGVQTGAVGGPIAFPVTGLRVMGAPGGAGVGTDNVDRAGGIITAITGSLLSDMRPQGAAAGSNNGSSGYLLRKPYGFWSYPGLGGSSSGTGVGGNGGNGGPGSGGGGGGGGTTGGRGGNGGPAFLMVYSW